MLGPIRRAWRVRGFGVHSPFAFNYLREIVRPRHDGCYYAEGEMKSARERLLYRIMVEASDKPHPPTLVALGPQQTAALDSWASGSNRGVLFIHPRRMAIFCRRPVPFLRLEISLPSR